MKTTLLAFLFAFSSPSAQAASFDVLDKNGDEMISKTEWDDSINGVGAFRNWDANADSYIDEKEFNDLDWDYDYSLWDRNKDAHLEDNEIYEGLFDAFDDDGDDHWDRAEWTKAEEEGWLDL